MHCGRKGSPADIMLISRSTTTGGQCRNLTNCNKAQRAARLQSIPFPIDDPLVVPQLEDRPLGLPVILAVEPRIRPRFTREDEATALQLLREMLEVNPSLMEVRIFLEKFG